MSIGPSAESMGEHRWYQREIDVSTGKQKIMNKFRDLCSKYELAETKEACTVTETNIERFFGAILSIILMKMVPEKRSI